MSFKEFKFHQVIQEGIQTLGFTAPTPIQKQSIQHMLDGKNILGLAQTGTGKTAAFVLPMLQNLLNGPRNTTREEISHVINYDFPDTIEIYTYRAGDTGRAQHSGKAVCFIGNDDRKLITAINNKFAIRKITTPGPAPGVSEINLQHNRPSNTKHRQPKKT